MLRRAVNDEEVLETGEFVEADGVRLHYLSRGHRLSSDDARPVVLLHGNAGFAQDFSHVLEALDAKEFRALSFDRPGHGLSQRPSNGDATMDAQARLLRTALRSIDVRKPVVVGHSWSGALALSYALQFPEETSALVLVAPAVFPEEEMYAAQRLFMQMSVMSDMLIRASETFVRAEIRRELARAFSPDEIPSDYLRTAEAVWSSPARVRAFVQDECGYNAAVGLLAPRYSEVSVPALLLTGDSDELVKPESHAYLLHRILRKSELAVLQDAGHMLPHTRPEAVAQAIRSAAEQSDPT